MTALAATTNVSPLWYFTRATGVVSLVLLTLVVLLGVLTRAGRPLPGLPRFAVGALHRNVSLLAVVLLAVHITTAILDPFAPIRLADAFLPFVSAYRPLWLGLGAFAFDLVLVLIATSLLRTRLQPRVWRAVHWAGYAAWPVAVVHGLGTGTDATAGWLLLITAGCVLVVIAAALYRLGVISGLPAPLRVSGGAAVLVAPVVLIGWLAVGPLAPHWAARAGTPARLLAHSRTAGAAATAPTTSGAARPTGAARWRAGVTTQVSANQQETVTIAGALTGGPGGNLRILLIGQPNPAGGVSLTSGTVTLTPSAGGSYAGAVTGLAGPEVRATITGPAGQVAFVVRLDQLSSSRASGQVTLT